MFKNKFLNNGSFATIDVLISPLLMIIVTPILLKYLGVENYGIWILINSIISSLALFNFGVTDIIIKYLSQYKAINDTLSIKQIYSSVFIFQVSIAMLIYFICLMIIYYLLPYFNINEASSLLLIAIPLFFIKQFEQLLYAFLKAHEKYSKVAFLSFISKIIFFAIQSFVAIYTSSVLDIFIYGLISSIIIYICEIVYLKYKYQYICFFKCISLDKIKLILNFGLWNWYSSMVSIINVHIDKWIVSAMFGMVIFSYYSIGILIYNQFYTIISSSISWVFPYISSNKLDKNKQLQLYYKLTIFILLISVLISFIFSEFNIIFQLWLGVDVYIHSIIYINTFLIMLPIFTMLVVSYYYIIALGLVKGKFLIDFKTLILKIVVIITAIKMINIDQWPLVFLIFLVYQIIFYSKLLKAEIDINIKIIYIIIILQLTLVYIRL